MLRNRLIFSLIHSDGAFMQSRNFRLQRVGDINWLERNYKFQKISFSLDELIVLDASKGSKDIEVFSKVVNRLVNNVFIPVAAGGGIRTIEDAEILFKKGADKVILNSPLYDDPQLAKDIIAKYGSQSLVGCVDYKIVNDKPVVFIHDGSDPIETPLCTYLSRIEKLGVGEILLNSINKDGTGFGYDLSTIIKNSKSLTVPLIIMGGAGNESHLQEGLQLEGVSAVATANLFNFIGNGLPNARDYMLANGTNLAQWT
jgi:cyclase